MTPVLWILALLPALAQDNGEKPDDKKVRALVEKLDADDPEARSQAERDLSAMDEGILPQLEKARAGAGAEVCSRLDRIVGELTLARRWVKELSGEEAEALQASGRLEQLIRAKTLDHRQAARILSAALLSPAIPENLRRNLAGIGERNQVVEIWPTLVELLSREDQEAGYALNSLQRLKLPKESTGEILKALAKMKLRGNVTSTLDLLVHLKPDRLKLDPVIQALLEDADDATNYSITNYLSSGRLQVSLRTALRCWNSRTRNIRQNGGREAVLRIPPDESVKEIVDLLGSSDGEEIGLAADYVGRYRLRQAAAPLAEALQKQSAEDRLRRDPAALWAARRFLYTGIDPFQVHTRLIAAFRALGPEDLIKGWLAAGGPPSRQVLVGLIGELDLRSLAALVVTAAGDKEALVRQAVARALATLPHPEAGATLENLLKDESIPVRRWALQSLAQVRGAAATSIVLEQLRSGPPDVQAMAVEVLPAMNLDLVLDDLTRGQALEGALTRYAIASLVATHGESLLHRVMARAPGKLSADELQAMVRLIQSARGLH